MNEVPIFDSLTHPNIDGDWLNSSFYDCNKIHFLLEEMMKHNIKWAFAVGMKGIDSYDEGKYAEIIRSKASNLYPIAFFDFEKLDYMSVKEYLDNLKKLGYVGVKIHPRIAKIDLKNQYLEAVVKHCNDLKLVVMLCTYFPTTYYDNIKGLLDLLNKTKDEKIILLHSCTTHLLDMREVASVYKNILLDLSFTICRYKGSSIDLNIKYLFENFDERICIGSDSPQYSSKDLRERFEFFSSNIGSKKRQNIAHKNIINFAGDGILK